MPSVKYVKQFSNYSSPLTGSSSNIHVHVPLPKSIMKS